MLKNKMHIRRCWLQLNIGPASASFLHRRLSSYHPAHPINCSVYMNNDLTRVFVCYLFTQTLSRISSPIFQINESTPSAGENITW